MFPLPKVTEIPAPYAGIEPATSGLIVQRSADELKEGHFFLVRTQGFEPRTLELPSSGGRLFQNSEKSCVAPLDGYGARAYLPIAGFTAFPAHPNRHGRMDVVLTDWFTRRLRT